MKYGVNIWIRIVVCLFMLASYRIFYALIGGNEATVFVVIVGLASVIFCILSIHLILAGETLQLRLAFPTGIDLRSIELKDIVSIDSHRHFLLTNVFLRLNPDVAATVSPVGKIMGCSDNDIGLNPLIQNRSDLIRQIIEKNTLVQVDEETLKFLEN